MTAEVAKKEEERRKLARTVQNLMLNDGFLLLWKKMKAMAPPQAVAFSMGDGYNPHAAAFRDGARSMTAFIQELALTDLGKEPKEAQEPKADFVG